MSPADRLARDAARWRAYRHAHRFRFRGRVGDTYLWERAVPGDSRTEQVTCSVAWFWSRR